MVKIEKGKRICGCGKVIKGDKDVCDTCFSVFNSLFPSKRSIIKSYVKDFITLVKYECGYTNKKPKGIFYE